MASSTRDFAHLHVHTEYSLLDGAAKIKKLVAEAVKNGQKSIAITDHGYLFGAYEFYKACKDADIRPIIGVEAYMTPGTSRHSTNRVRWGSDDQAADDVSARGAYTHMTLLSYNNTGMHNLFRMNSLASLEGQMGKWPRMDRELLEIYHEGLIGTAGCPSGEVQTRLRLGQWDEAVKAAGELQDIFGKENFFVEVMDHNNDVERRVRNDLLKLARHIDAPLIATNDSHYVTPGDAHVQDAMLCINSGSRLTDPDRFKFDGEGYHLRSTQEMYDLFGDLEGACENTLLIAERCDVSFRTTNDGANFMPAFPVPPGEDETSWFVKEVERGLHYRFGESVPQEVRDRATYEMDIITRMGFPGYFLVVSDYIRWAKSQGIRVGPGRGSGPGSMVAYALQITELNPLPLNLFFERFLNPERISMPDIDVDFDERRRDEVIAYVEEKYGKDNVSQVVTFGTIKSKQALKDATRVLGFPFEMGDRLTKAMPPSVQGKDIPLHGIYDENNSRYAEAEGFREVVEADPAARTVFDLALGLEGLTRQWGVHACAVIMSDTKLTDVIPVMKRPADGAVITQFEYPQCEELGLLKMDFLGLSNLTIIDDALANIAANGKEVPDMEKVPLDDLTTYQLLGRGDTLGVFQLDGSGMRTLLRQMRPTEFEDISAVSALYRPGPMGANSHTNYALRKNGLQKIEPIHAELAEPLKEILEPTYGLIVYQEQVMQIAQKVAGFTLGQADILRKAMGKKKLDVLNQQFVGFSGGMRERGYSDDCIKTLWDILVPFSQYAFNKSHSAAYGLVSYWTAYLKANFPVEYMAALLTSNKDKKDKLAVYLSECRRMGITVKVPDVNDSVAAFSAVGDEIRVGLEAVRGVGSAVVAGIIQARETKGAFESFEDFIDKIPIESCSKRVVEPLIKAGAFDSLGHTRSSLYAVFEDAVTAAIPVKKKESTGQFDLFAGLGDEERLGVSVDVPDLPEWEKMAKLEKEQETLGLYVSDHPLSGLEHVLDRKADVTVVHLMNDEEGTYKDGSYVTIAGLIKTVVPKISKKTGNPWANVVIEDTTGSIEVNFFSEVYKMVAPYLQPNSVVAVRARVSIRDAAISLNAVELNLVDVDMAMDAPIDMYLPEFACSPAMVSQLKAAIANHPGHSPLRLHVATKSGTKVIQTSKDYLVNPGAAFQSDVKAFLGLNVFTDPTKTGKNGKQSGDSKGYRGRR